MARRMERVEREQEGSCGGGGEGRVLRGSDVLVGSSLPPRVDGHRSGELKMTIAVIMPLALSEWKRRERKRQVEEVDMLEERCDSAEYEYIVRVLWWGESDDKNVTFRLDCNKRGEENVRQIIYPIQCAQNHFHRYLEDMGELVIETVKRTKLAHEKSEMADSVAWTGSTAFPTNNIKLSCEMNKSNLYSDMYTIHKKLKSKTDADSFDISNETVGTLAISIDADFYTQTEEMAENYNFEGKKRHRSSFEMNEHRSENDHNLPIFPSMGNNDLNNDANSSDTVNSKIEREDVDEVEQNRMRRIDCKSPDEGSASTSTSSALRKSIIGLKNTNSKRVRMMRIKNSVSSLENLKCRTNENVNTENLQSSSEQSSSSHKNETTVFKPTPSRSSPNASSTPKDIRKELVITKNDIEHEEMLSSLMNNKDDESMCSDPLDILLIRAEKLRHAMTAAIISNNTHEFISQNDSMFPVSTLADRPRFEECESNSKRNTTILSILPYVTDVNNESVPSKQSSENLDKVAQELNVVGKEHFEHSSISYLGTIIRDEGNVLPNAISVSNNNADEYNKFSTDEIADDALVHDLFFGPTKDMQKTIEDEREFEQFLDFGISVCITDSSFTVSKECSTNLLMRTTQCSNSSSFTLDSYSRCGGVWFQNEQKDEQMDADTNYHNAQQSTLFIEAWRLALLGIAKVDLDLGESIFTLTDSRRSRNRCEIHDIVNNKVIGWIDVDYSMCTKESHDRYLSSVALLNKNKTQSDETEHDRQEQSANTEKSLENSDQTCTTEEFAKRNIGTDITDSNHGESEGILQAQAHTFDVTILSASGACLQDKINGCDVYYYVRYCFPGEDEPLYTKVAYAVNRSAQCGVMSDKTLSLSARARHVISLPKLDKIYASVVLDGCDASLLMSNLLFELWSAFNDEQSLPSVASSIGCHDHSGFNRHTLVATAVISASDIMKHPQQRLTLPLLNVGSRCGELTILTQYRSERDLGLREKIPELQDKENDSSSANIDFGEKSVREMAESQGTNVEPLSLDKCSIDSLQKDTSLHEEVEKRKLDKPCDGTEEQVDEAVNIIETLNELDIDNTDFSGIDRMIEKSALKVVKADADESTNTCPYACKDDFAKTRETIKNITEELEILTTQITTSFCSETRSLKDSEILTSTPGNVSEKENDVLDNCIETDREAHPADGTYQELSESGGDTDSVDNETEEDDVVPGCHSRISTAIVAGELSLKTVHANITHTPSPAIPSRESQAVEEKESTEIPNLILPKVEQPHVTDHLHLGDSHEFHMSEYRRKYLQSEVDRITKIVGKKIDTSKLYSL